jgi:DNA-binding response OmpR family regulator
MISQQKSSSLKASNLTLNLRTKEAERNGRKIPLRRKEFELLQFLLKNKGAVINKDELLTCVWGYKSCIITNTIQAHIKNLRQKVDNKSKTPLIITVHGMGYKICA